MLSFLASQPPRTKQSHLPKITTENGATWVEFFPQTKDPNASTVAMRTCVKAGPTIHNPPYHWHKFQSETFTVEKGILRATLEGSDKNVHAGESVTIESGLYHTFANGSKTEDLLVLTGLDPLERERDEAFFRNLYGYCDDCNKVGKGPSIFQLCLFLHVFDCYLALPGPRNVAMKASEWLVWGLGVVIGKGLLGYKESYPEYWAGDIIKLRRQTPSTEGKKSL